MKKPFPVLATQIFLVLMLIPATLGFLMTIGYIPTMMGNGLSLTTIALGLGLKLVIVAALVFAFSAIWNRNAFGRLISIFAVLLIWGILLYRMGDQSAAHYQLSPQELRGAGAAEMLIDFLMLALLVSLIVSKRVRQYFSNNKAESQPVIGEE